MVYLHIRGPVIQHLGIHVLLGMHVQLLITRCIIELQLIKPAAHIRLRTDGHLRLCPRQAAGGAVFLVVSASHNDRLVRIAVEEVHNHLLTHARYRKVTESGACPRLCHTDPARAVLVCRVITVPVEFHPHSAMFITEDFLTLRPRHDGALRTVHQRF